MSDESFAAHLSLLALFEGGNPRWSHEYLTYGAEEFISRIKGDCYPDAKRAGKSLRQSLQDIDINVLSAEMDRTSAFLIRRCDPDWPVSLDDLSAPPIALVGRGIRSALETVQRSISIVGTRNPSDYGIRIAGEFAAGMVDRGWAVVSGGAFGIDSAAHRGALVAEGTTISILGGGVNSIFPSGNDRLFREICESGILISEVLPHIHAIPARFLIRNRIIAAISQATVVVEAAFRSGSLRTAREASEIFRPVFAVPGQITSPTSDGCHRLIGERKAEIVTSVSDLVELVSPLTH
jgi:DNA protecting protein DprA